MRALGPRQPHRRCPDRHAEIGEPPGLVAGACRISPVEALQGRERFSHTFWREEASQRRSGAKVGRAREAQFRLSKIGPWRQGWRRRRDGSQTTRSPAVAGWRLAAMVRAMQRCASWPAPGGAANLRDDGGLARRTLAGAGRWREASGRGREAQFRLSKIGPAAAGPEGDSAAREVKKWCLGRSRLAGGARALIFQLAQLRQLVGTKVRVPAGAISEAL